LYPFGSDNVGYVLREPQTNSLIGIDVGDVEQSDRVIKGLEREYGAELRYILTTHKHWDHVDGNLHWKQERPDLKIYGSEKGLDLVPGLEPSNAMHDLQTMTIGDLCICCMETPGHTADHCSFIVTHVTPESNKNPFLFCGDTLFIGGVGRLLDGPTHGHDLFESVKKLMALPNETLVFCGHEYSVKNLEFAEKVEPENDTISSKLDLMRQMRADKHFTMGSPLMDERLYNPFVRCFGSGLDTKEYYA